MKLALKVYTIYNVFKDVNKSNAQPNNNPSETPDETFEVNEEIDVAITVEEIEKAVKCLKTIR